MSESGYSRIRRSLFYPLSYAIWLAVAFRGIGVYFTAAHPLRWIVVGLLLVFGLLLGLEQLLGQRRRAYAHFYLLLQTILVLILSVFPLQLDFFSALYLPLSGQAMLLFPRRVGYFWVAVFSAAMAGAILYQYRFTAGLPLLILYAVGYLFIATYANMTIQAEAARQESDRLLNELQEAHQQLQAYAQQVEELAVMEERNRLARELHDSVTQALYAMRLETASAIRQLTAGKNDLALGHLHELRQGVQQALREMRLLIYELRPPALEKEGLVTALKSRLESVEARTGIQVDFHFVGQGNLSTDVEVGLYRIAQEALNNILKHSQARKVTLDLSLADDWVAMEIRDDGIGFNASGETSTDGGGMGLQGMRERAAQMGGTLQLTAEPGEGTRVKVEVRP